MKGARKVKSPFATLVASLFVSAAVAAAPKSAGGIARGVQPGRGEMLIHSHNDYAQKRPFWGAYEAGADSIEADIFLVDGDLLVAHSRKELRKENSLRRLYLEPLRSVMRKNGGRARATGKPIQLLVDRKNGKPAPDRLVEMIEKEGFRECFDIAKNPSAARLTVTGDHSKVEDLFTYPDFVFFDMPPTRVLADGQYRRVPLISHYARAYTRWRSGVMAEEDKEKIRAAVRQAHEKGSKFRLWGYPDNPEAWRLALELGLDYINTDRPAAAAAFLRGLGAGAEGESSAAFEWDFTKGLPKGGKLRAALAAKCAYAPKTDSSSPEIVTYSRAWGGTPYVFAVNDKRTFGDYVGQWGLTMEKGLPFAGEVTLADPEGRINAVYELSRGGEVKFSRRDGRVAVPLSYDTNDGRLLLFLPQKIASVDAEVAKVGDALSVSVTMTVREAAGEPVKALLPVEVRVYDAAGRELDGAGYACAKDGVCRLSVRTNINDAPGGYRVVCRDRASGLACERWAKNPPRLMKVEGIPPEGV